MNASTQFSSVDTALNSSRVIPAANGCCGRQLCSKLPTSKLTSGVFVPSSYRTCMPLTCIWTLSTILLTIAPTYVCFAVTSVSASQIPLSSSQATTTSPTTAPTPARETKLTSIIPCYLTRRIIHRLGTLQPLLLGRLLHPLILLRIYLALRPCSRQNVDIINRDFDGLSADLAPWNSDR
jgi:hypothetical protein